MFLVTALLSYIVTSTQDEGVGGGEEDEEGEETKATAKARGKGKATPTTTVSNEGAADSDMPEPGKSSATRTKRTVDAAGGGGEDKSGGGTVPPAPSPPPGSGDDGEEHSTTQGMDAVVAGAEQDAQENPPPPPHLQQQLCAAIKAGDVEMARKLVGEDGADPSVVGPDDPLRPPVYLAAAGGFLELVKVLLEHRGDPNQVKTDNGYTPICVATKHGHLDIVKVLLDHNADPNQALTTGGGTPLSIAAAKGHVDVVTVLLAKNADPNQAKTTDGRTPLFTAAMKGHVEVVTVLLAKNADPNQALTTDGLTPLFAAALKGHVDVVTVLLAKNADPNQAMTDEEYGDTPLRIAELFDQTAVADLLKQHGAGSLHDATTVGDLDHVNLLLDHNADPNTPNNKGERPLKIAVDNLNFTVAASLVAHGANPTTATTSASSLSLLYLAAEAGEHDLVEELLKCAHGVAPPTTSGRADVHVTPIDIAKHNNHMEVVRLLNGAAASGGDEGGAGAAEASGAAATEATFQQPPLPPHIIAILTAESSLLPPPPAVLHWLQGGSNATPSGEPHDDLAKQATEWLIKVVQAAHLSPRIKQAGRKLMACYSFTVNLEHLRCWSQLLIPQLTATLQELGAQAKAINAASNLAAILTTDHILAVAEYNFGVLPDGHATPRDVIRQDMLMPLLTDTVSSNFKGDWKKQPEHVYVHVLLLIATALNPLFGSALETLLSELEGVEVHSAAIKSFTRMINKLMTADDHRYVEQQPRPAMNIDIVRRLVSATTPEAVLELAKLVAARFGGLSYVKCLPELAATNPAAADARYHMLPVMVTVVFAPHGVTVGSLLADPNVLAAWAKLRATRPSNGVSAEEWEAFHDAAVQCLVESDPNEPATMHCEVQVVTTAMAAIRNVMHEVYKVVRASDGTQLHADVAKPEVEKVVDVDAILSKVAGGGGGGEDWGDALGSAAEAGRIATVKKLLVAVRGGGGGSAGSGSAGGVDVNWQDEENDGVTAVWCAAQNGHLSVVLVLLEHGADPNIARTTTGSTPMCMAAQKGFFEVVKVLLAKDADPNQATTDDGQTPLIAAAREGHVDVVTVLLAKNADPNQATTDEYEETPLTMAVDEGHTAIADLLRQHGAV